MPYLDSLVLHYYITSAKCIGDTGRQRNMDCLHSVSYISSHSYNRYQVHYFIHSYCSYSQQYSLFHSYNRYNVHYFIHSYCSYSQYLIFIISFIQQVSCCFSHEARILLKFGMNHFNFPVPMAWCHTDNEILHSCHFLCQACTQDQ